MFRHKSFLDFIIAIIIHTGGGSEALYTSDGGYSGFMVMVAIESGWCSFSITIMYFVNIYFVSCARVVFDVLNKSAPSERRLGVGASAVVGPMRDGNSVVGILVYFALATQYTYMHT